MPDQQPSYQVPPPPPPGGIRPIPPRPRRGGMSGCLVALFVTVAIGVVLAVVLVLAVAAGGMAEGFDGTAFASASHQRVTRHTLTSGTKTKVAVIAVNGIIQSGAMGGSSSSEGLIELLNAAANDGVAAIVLDMNTPGGEVVATDEVYHRIMQLRKDKGIKFVTCMRSIAASGGYYLAAGTDHIVANRMTFTGSIGVMIGGYNLSGLLNDKLGVTSEVYKSGDLKDILNPARPRGADEARVVQDLVDETYKEFQKIVAEGRGISIETIDNTPEIRDGRVLSGTQALQLKLIDELGYFEDALAKAKSFAGADDATVVRYGPKPSLLDVLLAGEAKQPPSLVQLLDPYRAQVRKGQLYFLCPLSF